MSERWKPSVTVASVIEQVQGGVSRFLLVEEETTDGLKLNNPAGHLDPGESPEQGAVRETLEETAFTFTPECVVGLYLSRYRRTGTGEDVTYLRITYAGQVGEPDLSRKLDIGIVRTLWMTLPELQASRDRHRSPLVMTCIEDYLAGRRFPLSMVKADPSLFDPDPKP